MLYIFLFKEWFCKNTPQYKWKRGLEVTSLAQEQGIKDNQFHGTDKRQRRGIKHTKPDHIPHSETRA